MLKTILYLFGFGFLALLSIAAIFAAIYVPRLVRKLRRDPYVRRWWVQQSLEEETYVTTTGPPKAFIRIHNPDNLPTRDVACKEVKPPHLRFYDPDPLARLEGVPLGAA